MPANLTEAFQSPSFESTQSGSSSIKNTFQSNSSFHDISQINSSSTGIVAQQNNQGWLSGFNPSRDNDTLSLMSSITNGGFNDEIQEIKEKYQIKEGFSDKKAKCDLHIYHILSCAKCRKKMKRLLSTQAEEDQFNEDLDDSEKTAQSGGGFNLDLLTNGNINVNVQNLTLYVMSGIFIILLLDFLNRILGR